MPENTPVTEWVTIGGVTTYANTTAGADATIFIVNNLPQGQTFTFGFYDSTGTYTGMITDPGGQPGGDSYMSGSTSGACALCHGYPLLSSPRP